MPPRTPPSISKARARHLWLRAQRLDQRAPFGAGPQATVEHLGYVQIDTIHVIERCHHHILYSRIPEYQRKDLRQAQTTDKSVFEYWTHALVYVPTRDLRFFIPAMRQDWQSRIRHRARDGYALVTNWQPAAGRLKQLETRPAQHGEKQKRMAAIEIRNDNGSDPAMRSLILAALLASASTTALAAPTPDCSMDGFRQWPHPEDLEAQPRADWPTPKGDEVCAVVTSSLRESGGRAWRFTFARIGTRDAAGGFGTQVGAFVAIGRLQGDVEVPLGRFAVPGDLLEGRDGAIDVQVVETDGRVLASLTRASAELFVISGDAAERLPNSGWYGDVLRILPPADTAGRILHFDFAGLSAVVAVHRAGAGDPAKPGSYFEPRRVILASLEWRAGGMAMKEARIAAGADVPASYRGDADDEDMAAIRARVGALPRGTEPCWVSAWSADRDPKGLNVRAEPSAQAKVLGQLAPPMKDPDLGETLAKEVSIIGYRSGWFLIDTRIEADEEKQGVRAGRKRWFEGRGWISARMVAANTAHSGLGEHKLFAAPTPLAHWTIGRQQDGAPLTGDSALARIHACSWTWALVDAEGGQRGWRRRLCSNQLTTCP